MNEQPRRVLCALVAEHGSGLAADPRRTVNYLNDLCWQYGPEIFALASAQEAGIAADLLTGRSAVPAKIRLAQLAKRMEARQGLPAETARWAVETWALALGVIGSDELTLPAGDPGVAAPTGVPKRSPIVAADGTGDCRSIGEALAMAESGATITVRPGVYRESFPIDKRVDLRGEGSRGASVIEGAGPCLRWTAATGDVRNLTFRATGDTAAVEIAAGEARLHDCDVQARGVGILVLGPTGRVSVRGGSIRDARRGIDFGNGASGLMAGCEVADCDDCGILIRDARVTVQDCTLRGGRQGIVVTGGAATIERNELVGQAGPGIVVEGTADPVIRQNSIHDGRAAGVLVRGGGRGTLEGNTIAGNGSAGVRIEHGGAPVLRHGNRITNNAGAGIFVVDGGLGIIEASDISGNTKAGVSIGRGGDPTLRGNRIHDNLDAGVLVYQDGKGLLEENTISGNAGPGVTIAAGGEPRLRRNTVADGKNAGVYVLANGQGCFEGDDIRGNASAGVVIAGGGNPTLRGCRITNNGYVAVWLERDAAGTVEGCDLRDNASGAWAVHPSATTERRDNVD